MDRPLLVGWSYGAPVALHWAGRNPDRVLGVVSVDGAYPFDFSYAEERIRRLWRRSLPLHSTMGMAGKMSAEQHAQSNIDPVFDRVTCPVRYVVATGADVPDTTTEVIGIISCCP